ncbi:MAG: MerR family transcriptional regulator, partial [Hyphomicrobiales bacterium]
MPKTEAVLSPAEAARHLGVSSKALRLYEERGFVRPIRDTAGWRHYGPEQMAVLQKVVALRSLGLSLAQIGAVLLGKSHDLDEALGEHQTRLEGNLAGMLEAIEQVRLWRNDLSAGRLPDLTVLAKTETAVSLPLPWPWNGEI